MQIDIFLLSAELETLEMSSKIISYTFQIYKLY